MPGLVLFNRKWLIAADDLVIPFAIEAFFRGILTIATPVITWVYYQKCHHESQSNYLPYILFMLLLELILSLHLCGAIIYFSSRGTTLQDEKRRWLSYFLYMKLSLVLFDVCIGFSYAWVIHHHDELGIPNCPEILVFAEIVSFSAWAYLAAVIIGTVISYNPLGALKLWKAENVQNLKELAKSIKVWERRLRWGCCCIGINKNNHRIYKDVASFLATFFPHVDLVPTDILAGLLLVNKKQTAERKNSQDKQSKYDSHLNFPNYSTPYWMTAENALYFLGLAKSTYSCQLTLGQCDPCKFCSMASQIKGLICHGQVEKSSDGTNVCFHHQAAMEKATGFSIKDIIYISITNGIYEPTFFIAINHQKSSVVVCIRGTFSLPDLVTDIDAESEKFTLPNTSQSFYSHRGTLRSAQFMYKKIQESNVLRTAFSEYPNYRLVMTGHSLGGSISSVLGLYLRQEYPDLRCYVYAPLAVLCANGVDVTREFAFTVTVGHDMSPRLCVRTCDKLRLEVIECLQECGIEKYKIMFGAFSKTVFNKKCLKKIDFAKPPTNKECTKGITTIEELSNDFAMSKYPHLYAPGTVLYLENTPDGVKALQKTGLDFQSITVSPSMIKDHQPRAIQTALEEFIRQTSEQKALLETCVTRI